MYSRLHFANYSLLRIRDLSGPYRHRRAPQKKLCWHKEGEKYMSPPDRIIHFTGIFSLQCPAWKINTLSSSASRVYNSLLCLLWSADRVKSRMGVGVINWTSLWFVPYSISTLDNCFWTVRVSRSFFSLWLFPSCHFQAVYHSSRVRTYSATGKLRGGPSPCLIRTMKRERNTSWGMLTTLNGNCPTLLFKHLYESKSNWNEGGGSQTCSPQSPNTGHILEVGSRMQTLSNNSVAFLFSIECLIFDYEKTRVTTDQHVSLIVTSMSSLLLH